MSSRLTEDHYQRLNDIVRNDFPKILVPIFKREWKKCTSLTWMDNPQSGDEFCSREIRRSRYDNRIMTIRNGDSSKFDCSALFYIILFSNSVGEKLWLYDRAVYSEVDELRRIRNEIVHRPPNNPMYREEFQDWFARITNCFRELETGFDLETLGVAENVTSPEFVRNASCQYPRCWTKIMRNLTKLVYSMNWEEVDKEGKKFIVQTPDWSVKLLVRIELAYSFCVRGKGEKASELLKTVVQNVKYANNSHTILILSRSFSRQALCHIFEQDIAKAKVLAEQALSLIATFDSPEEDILATKRLADAILNGEGTVQERRNKLEPLYQRIIEVSGKHKDDIPRCLEYERFAYQDKARLCLGFTRHGFIETTREELEEGERYLKVIEENADFKDTDENTYPNAFIFVCKSIARYKRWEMEKDERQKKEIWKEACKFSKKARDIACKLNTEAKTENNGLKLMINLLDQYEEPILRPSNKKQKFH